MSSIIFQPLLHDPLGWKPSKSTYVDHYKWRRYGTRSKNKKFSTYGQLSQKQQANRSLPLRTNGDETIDRIILVKKTENKPETPARVEYSPVETPIYVVEYKQRPVSVYENSNSNSKTPQRPPTAPSTIEEKTRPVTPFDNRPTSSKEEKPRTPVDANNDNSRHWLTYPNPKTPQYLLDIKQRLGQLKGSSTLGRPSSATVQQEKPVQSVPRVSSATTQRQQEKQQIDNDDRRYFLTYETRETPDDLRAMRYRLDKNRYNASLDNYPPRPKTCPVHRNPTPQETPIEQPTPTPNNDAWIIDESKKPPTPIFNPDSSSSLVQVVDCDDVPDEYVEALEVSNIAQEEYRKALKMNNERKLDNFVYRLSSANKNDSLIAYNNHQQQSTDMQNQLRHVSRSGQNDFGTWVRNATDKERASAMKILQEVLYQPINQNDNQMNQKRQGTIPTQVRSSSAPRKLGRTRNQHKFPCEICEKLLIKRHLWDLNTSQPLTCPQHPQGIQKRS